MKLLDVNVGAIHELPLHLIYDREAFLNNPSAIYQRDEIELKIVFMKNAEIIQKKPATDGLLDYEKAYKEFSWEAIKKISA